MRICVYGASSNDISPIFINAGEQLGYEMAKRNIGLTFGGGANGMMGAVARGITKGDGNIIGVAPKFFNVDGVLYEHCDEMIRPDTMRQRKQIMEDNADGFIVTPGGIGTFEEFFEILTLKQLGQLNKPIVIMNTDGYYDDMLNMMQTAVEKDFIMESVKSLYAVLTDINEILDYIQDYNCDKIDINDYKKV